MASERAEFHNFFNVAMASRVVQSWIHLVIIGRCAIVQADCYAVLSHLERIWAGVFREAKACVAENGYLRDTALSDIDATLTQPFRTLTSRTLPQVSLSIVAYPLVLMS